MYFNFSNFQGWNSAGGTSFGPKMGTSVGWGGLTKFSPDGGGTPQEKKPACYCYRPTIITLMSKTRATFLLYSSLLFGAVKSVRVKSSITGLLICKLLPGEPTSPNEDQMQWRRHRGNGGIFKKNIYFLASLVYQKIISNVFKLAEIRQFSIKMVHFCALHGHFAPVPSKYFDAGTTTSKCGHMSIHIDTDRHQSSPFTRNWSSPGEKWSLHIRNRSSWSSTVVWMGSYIL